MEIQIAAVKTDQFNNADSGDTIEAIERPNGGISVVLASGNLSGKNSKAVSQSVVKKIIALIADGVRDGAAARAASDALFTERNGRATASLCILSADLQSGTLVLTCNSQALIFLARDDSIETLDIECELIGTGLEIKPSVTEIPINQGLSIVVVTAGVLKAGSEFGQTFDIHTSLIASLEEQEPTAKYIADVLLSQAIRLDQGQPNNDMSIVVLRITSKTKDNIRSMTINLPIIDLQ